MYTHTCIHTYIHIHRYTNFTVVLIFFTLLLKEFRDVMYIYIYIDT